MQLESRRRLDRFILVAGAVVVGVAAAIGAVAGDSERITSFWAGAQLHDDGSASITEVIDYDFGNAQGKHGIFRDVPGLAPNAHIQVSSPDAPADLDIEQAPFDSPSFPATRLRIGNPDQTISGRHRYVITYDLDSLTRGDAVSWDAVGAAWPVQIEKSHIELVGPKSFTNVQCFRGQTGSTDTCTADQPQPGRLVSDPGSLDAGQGVTIDALASAPLPATPALDIPTGPAPPGNGAGIALPAVVGLVAALVGAAPASFLVRRKGRERVGVGGAADAAWSDGGEVRLVDAAELEGMATIEFAPPRELTPPEGGILLAEGVKREHKVAWLIDEAIDGSIDVVEEGGGVTLYRRNFGDPTAAPVLNAMFGERGEIPLGKYDRQFASGWSQLDRDLHTWADTSGLWDPAGDRRLMATRIAGVIAGIIGIVVAAISAAVAATHGKGWVVGVAVGGVLAGAGLAAVVRSWELRVRTARGSGLWLRVESFRRFLAASEAHHAEEAAARGVLREYTAWAVAVGEIDRWTRAMQAATNIPDPSALSFAYLVPALVIASSSASTAPASHGGGGGGGFGGGVGGGGGGGGGGSW